MQMLRVTLKRSPVGSKSFQRATLVGLGLRRPNDQRLLENTPSVRGMIRQVIHMLEVDEVEIDLSTEPEAGSPT